MGTSREWNKNFNRVLKEHGWPEFATLMDLWEADHMLIAEVPDVAGVALPEGWRNVGPIFAHLAGKVAGGGS